MPPVRHAIIVGLLLTASVVPTWPQTPAAASPRKLVNDAAVQAALTTIKDMESTTIADQIRFCEIAAPSFKEEARGRELQRVFQQLGLANVRVDHVGNVLGDYPGTAQKPRLVVAAHLDTVFPEDTDVHVKRDGAILRGPGIGDDCRGLAVLVAIAKSLKDAKIRPNGTLTFVANVGEEGLGDLRGVKALFNETLKDQIDEFVSIDGTGVHVTNVAVGSHRYKFTFKGPGGHSFGAFGRANPIGAMGRAIDKIQELQVPKFPKTTFNVGRIGGGTSVNSIPFEGWMEVDMRSADPAALAAIDGSIQKAVDAAVAEENRRWNTPGMISVVKELVGDRPAGSTREDSPIVKAGLDAAAALGLTAELGEGSTDSNTPMSMQIPAITIGGGGIGRDSHALTESFDTTDAWKGAQYALLLTIALTN